MFLNKKNKTRGIVRVPVIMQLETAECGAACLAMILAYYKKWIPLEQLRKDCGVSRDGVNALNIVQAGTLYDLESSGNLYELDEIKKQVTFPCIIHWNFNHFVVLKGFRKNRAYINDPESGARSVSMEEFDRSFTGVSLEFKTNKNFKPTGHKKSVLKFARRRLKNARQALFFAGLITAILLLIKFLFPVFERILVDYLLDVNNPSGASIFLGVFSGLALLYLMVQFINAICAIKINGRFSISGSTSYMWKVLNLPFIFFSQRYAGDIKSRKDTNAGIANSLINIFIPIALQSFMVIFYVIIMFSYSWILSLIGISAVLIDMISTRIVTQKRINLARAAVRDEAKLTASSAGGISMIETIKANGAENGFFNQWSGYQANLNNREVELIKIGNILNIVLNLISTLADTFIIIIGVILIMNNQFTIGLLMAFQGFMYSFTSPAKTVVDASQQLMEMRTEMERLDDVMEYSDDTIFAPSDNKDYQKKKLSGEINLKHVNFGYARFAPPLIKDFSLSIKPGDSIAFVGNSGSGKSTLIKLIIGLYEPWDGEILFDHLSLKKIPKNRFTTSVAVVSQDITLFEDTIINNIKMFNEKISTKAVIKACKDVHIHEDILKRPGGYNATLNEGGKNLSGGQRQRMELARILANNPNILVLDEATSALDAKTEYAVIKSLKKRGLTNIIVAHRLSTIRSCNKIVVLKDGKILDQGNHKELMARCPYYQKLVTNE